MLLEPGTTCWRMATATRATALLDTQNYFLAAKAAMLKARRSIYLLGWAFDPLTQLTPGPDGGGPVDDRAGPFIRELARTRPEMDVRVLIWKSALPIAASQHFFPHRARECFKDSPVRFRLDASVPLGACHHQKVLVIDDVLAFCGGGDMSTDRWDSTRHLDGDHRRHMPSGGTHDPRHEVMLMVEGEAATMMGDLVRRRWRRSTGEPELPPPAVAGDPWPDHVQPDFRDVTVGVARTEPAWRDQPEVRENEVLHLRAIAAAKRHIYLENQYVASPAIGEALAARLAEDDGPEVLIVSTEHSPSWFDRMTMDKTRSALIRRLQGADKHGRFHAYCPETPKGATVIVHAKHTVIDDVLLRVGSTNLNNRSTGFDSECDLAVEVGDGPEDAPARAAIHAHRTATLAHFLAVTPEAFDAEYDRTRSLAGAVEALDTGPQRRLRKLGPVKIGPLANLIATFHLGDPLTPTDSWRPWRRRRDLQADLRRIAPELAERPLLADPSAGVGEEARHGEHATPVPKPTLKAEDFLQSD